VTESLARLQYRGVSPAAGLVSQATAATAPVAVESVYQAEFAYVWHTLRRLGVRPRDLEDRVHDVFVVVHRRWRDYDPARPLRPWLFGIALRVAADDRRRAARAAEVELGTIEQAAGAEPAADERIAAAKARELVLAALEALDLDQRAALVMHDLDGASAPEISAALAIPLNTVYSRLRLAREKFAAAVRRLRARRGEAP